MVGPTNPQLQLPRLTPKSSAELPHRESRLVKLLCFENENGVKELFAVADPDQCIYVFSGADPELLKELTERHDVADIRLKRNYRSGDRIIRAATALLPVPVEVEGESSGGTVERHQAEGKIEGQAEAALSILVPALAKSKPEDLAVVCISNADCELAADILIGRGQSVFVRRQGEYGRTPATAFVESAAEWATTERGSAGVPLSELLRQWRRLLGRSWDRSKEIDLARLLLQSDVDSELANPDSDASIFVDAVCDLGLLAALQADSSRPDDAEALANLRSAVASGPLAALSLAELGDRAFARNRIHVLTMHACKGLEFDVVCALGLESTRLPRYKAPPWEALQQRRQFYVTITRARDQVHLFYTGWRINKFGNRYDHGPSPFIAELGI